MRHPFLSSLSSMLLLAATVSSCSDDPAGPSDASHGPGVGSTFTVETVSYNEFGTETKRETSTMRVVQSGASFNGRSNVAFFAEVDPKGDTIPFCYHEDGDLEVPFMFRHQIEYCRFEIVDPQWIALASSNTGTARVMIDYDSTAYINGVKTRCTVRRTASHLGKGSAQVKGTTLQTWRTEFRYEAKLTGYLESYESEIDTVDYAPSIGMFVKGIAHGDDRDQFGTSKGTRRSTLTDYSLK